MTTRIKVSKGKLRIRIPERPKDAPDNWQPGMGTWTADFRVNGKRYQRSILPVVLKRKGDNKGEAEIEFEKLKTHVREGQLHLLSKADSFEKVADYYLADYLAHGKPTKGNISGAKSSVGILKRFFGNRSCHEITPFLLRKLESERMKNGCTTTRISQNMKAIMNKAERDELIDPSENKIRNVKVKYGKARRVIIPPEHLENILDNFTYQRRKPNKNGEKSDPALMRDCVRFMLLGAFRPREAIESRWENSTDTHYVVPGSDETDPDDPRGTSKTRRHKKPLTPVMREILARRNHKTGFVFSLDGGKTPLNYWTVRLLWQKARIRAGYASLDYQMKDLRRTQATRLYKQTRDILKVSRLLGHATIQMTAWYLQPEDDYVDDLAGIMDDALVTQPKVIQLPVRAAKQA